MGSLKEDADEPPILTQESYYKQDDGEDNFEEIEESDEEELNLPGQSVLPVSSKISTFDEAQTSHQPDIEDNYELRESFPAQYSKSQIKYDFDHSKYLVEYRDSQYRSKFRTKQTHKVAIVAKIDENVCHEFNYNRTSDYDGSKFYTCLGCRKAKVDTRMKDVVRTIKIADRYRQILSKGDPFMGHHIFCVPLPWSPDARSYGHALPQPMHMDLGEYAPSELVYVDTDGTEGIWDNAESAGLINLATIPFYGEEVSPKKDNSTSETRLGYRRHSYFSRYKKKNQMTGRRKPKCHLCFAVLSSTEKLIKHLQKHISVAKTKSSKQITGRKIQKKR